MIRIIFLVALISLFLACSKNTSPTSTPPATSVGLMPLSVGNFWQFSKISYDSTSGEPIDTVSDEIDIIGEVTVNGTTYFQQTQESITNIDAPSYFINLDSNTLEKIDSATEYIFFKRVNSDSSFVASWKDTVTSRCKGQDLLYAFTDTAIINGYNCLRNVVYVNDCTGLNFEQWVYYLKPGLGLVRILHYALKNNGTFYLQFSEDLKSYHTD